MFDSRTPPDTESGQLPHAATRCVRACSCADHATAERLRARSSGENGRSRKRRAARLKRQAAAGEANAAALAEESR